MTDYIRDVFGEGGLLAKKFERYQPRLGQVQLAYAVDDAMNSGRNLVAEAPTGIGKSVGYGVPAVKAAVHGEKVVIVTANIALQEQLVMKDLPLMSEVLPYEFKFALAKGLNNYLCKDALDDTINETIMASTFRQREQMQWDEIVKWSAMTKTGDVSELPFEPLPVLRPKFTTMSEDCLGKKCDHYGSCHAIESRRGIKEAHVVVTNYHLFFADLLIKRGDGEGILPNYRHVVFDEGHKAAEIARDFLGFRISRGSLDFATRMLDSPKSKTSKKGPLPTINKRLREECVSRFDELFAELTSYYHSNFKVRFREPWTGRMMNYAERVAECLLAAAKDLAAATALPSISYERSFELERAAGKCESYARSIIETAHHTGKDWCFFLEEENDRIVIKGKPVDVGKYLRQSLFNYKDGKNAIKSVTVTSATLATARDDFKFIRGELGIDDADELTVESPFKLDEAAVFIVPPMPVPNAREFPEAVGERMIEAVQYARGRTLCLFTSYRVLNVAYEALVNANLPYRILKQGEAPRTQLIKVFKEDVSSVLLGTESFWAGVDVPGEALSCVVIDKIPFPNISDPLEDMLKDKYGKRYFFDISVPKAVISFRQGSGRLIRSVTDRGVIVMLDCRVREKNYGSQFTRSFPRGMKIAKDMSLIEEYTT